MSGELIVDPDVEQVLVEHLSSQLGFPWSGAVPAARPSRFGVVRQTGGVEVNLVVDELSILAENWAPTDEQASEDARRTRAVLKALDRVGAVTFYRVRPFSLPQNLPDPRTPQARYSALYAIRVRAVATPL